ncbi:nuclear transport factor 2 family protein [Sulfitobacter sp. F26204]|uniref:nuclear transport factor 2 family protein n=1 Tax=Sulfitobacter sp. F26204 TaxID=2996014 RepID=UPI00225E6E19|nr:nuclear transport factor 2 family protein [Sulfitobacter sp. F26204]MCX7558537.1 nuclear transport factor 2 family protein [Sulfitobacter sp. F26204]
MTEQTTRTLLATITRYEQQVWDALVSGDVSADETLLGDAFLGVYSDGFATKQDHSGQLANGAMVLGYDMHDIKVLPLGPEHALISYRACFRRSSNDQNEVMFVSSIWQNDGDRWINIFSQDTPLVE